MCGVCAPAGGRAPALPARRVSAVPGGGRRGGSRPPTLPLVLLSPPSPQPPSRREGGDYRFILPGAAAPGTPALNRLRHLQFPPYRYPAKGSLRLGAKTAEMLSFGQCRQPRRGGTGGDGTIRRTRRRRLRWSSPPGQGWQATKRASPLRISERQGRQATKTDTPPRRAPGTAGRADAAPTPQKKYRRPPRFCVSRL